MISGSVLLSKRDEYPTVLKKRVLRIVLLLLLFIFIYHTEKFMIVTAQGEQYTYTIDRVIWSFFSGIGITNMGPLWYLYAYIDFLLFLPMMQRVAQRMEKYDFGILIALHFFIFAFVPTFNVLLSILGQKRIEISSSFNIPLARFNSFFFPLIGYYLDNKLNISKLEKKHIIKLIVGSFIGIVIACACTYYEGITTGEFKQTYVQAFDWLFAITAFLLIKKFVTGHPDLEKGTVSNLVVKVGSLTLGIYLLDQFWALLFYEKYESFIEPFLPTIFVSVIWILISMLIGGLTTLLLKKTPLKRLL